MPVYNGAKYLKVAIDSVLAQTYSDFEFIIINDGSTDETLDIINSYSDPRIVLVSQENKGVTKSLNVGLKIAKGEIIARLDADDIAEPERFAKQMAFLESNPAITLVGSRAVAIDKDGNMIENFDYPPLTHKAIKKYYIFHNPFIHSTVMFRKAVIDVCGPYNEAIIRAQDYDFLGRIITKFQSANLPERLVKYRIHDERVTKKYNRTMRWTGLKIRLRFLLNYFQQ